MFIEIIVHLLNTINVRQIELFVLYPYFKGSEMSDSSNTDIYKMIYMYRGQRSELSVIGDILYFVKRHIVGCFIFSKYDTILIETRKLSHNVGFTQNRLCFVM